MKIKQYCHGLRHKVLAAFTAVILIAGIIPEGILAQNIETVKTVNFGTDEGWNSNEGFREGEEQNGWFFKPVEGSSIIKLLDQGNGDNCLNFITYPETHTQWPEAKYLFEPTSKRFTEISFDTYFEMDHPNGYTMQLLFDSAENTQNASFIDMINISAIPGYSVYEQLDGKNMKIMPTLPYGAYVNFRIRFDNNCDGNRTKRISLYAGDTCVYEVNTDRVGNAYGIQGLRFTTKSDAYDADFRIDNISITQTDREATPYRCSFEQAEGWETNEGFDPGETYGGWKFKTTSGNNTIKIADQGQGNQALNFITYPNTHTQWPAARMLFPSTTKRVTDVKFKTSFKNGHSKGYTMQLLFNDTAGYDDAVDNKFVDIMSIAAIEGYSVYEKLDGKNTKIVPTVPYDTECEFLVRFDHDSDAKGTKRIYLYKDGVFLFSSAMDSELYSQKTGVKGIRFTTTSDAYDADFMIDDIEVSQSSVSADSSTTDFNSGSGWTQNSGFASGESMKGWTFSTTPENNCIKILNQGGEDHCLNIITYPDTHTQWPVAQYAVTQTSRRFTSFAFKTYITQGHNTPYKVGAIFDDTESTWTDLLQISPEGVREQVTADKNIIIPELAYDTYHSFDLVYDNQADENGVKKLYVFLGNALIETISLPADVFSGKTGIKNIRFNLDSTAYNADFRIDDVSVRQSNDGFFIDIEDEAGQPLGNLKEGSVNANIKVINLANSALPVSAAFASYYNNTMNNVQVQMNTIGSEKIGEINLPVVCEGTENLCRLYLWNSFEGIMPYRVPVSLF